MQVCASLLKHCHNTPTTKYWCNSETTPVFFDYFPSFVFNNGTNHIFISVTPEALQMLEVCKFICGAQNPSRLKCHTLIGLSFCWWVTHYHMQFTEIQEAHFVYNYMWCLSQYPLEATVDIWKPAVSMHVSVCIFKCMHARVRVHILYLTCGVGPLSGTSPAVLGANAPSLQQSLEGTVLSWWGNTAEPLGTGQCVHTTGLSLGQHWCAAGNIMVPRGAPCPQWILAAGTDLEGAQAVCPGPWSAVSNQQQDNGC